MAATEQAAQQAATEAERQKAEQQRSTLAASLAKLKREAGKTCCALQHEESSKSPMALRLAPAFPTGNAEAPGMSIRQGQCKIKPGAPAYTAGTN
jgi:hypothetical protein